MRCTFWQLVDLALQTCFTSHVDTGSGPHCLAGKFMMILENSAVVTARNIESVPADRGSTTADGADSVDWQILHVMSIEWSLSANDQDSYLCVRGLHSTVMRWQTLSRSVRWLLKLICCQQVCRPASLCSANDHTVQYAQADLAIFCVQWSRATAGGRGCSILHMMG